MLNFSMLLAMVVITQQMYANPTHKRKQGIKCGKERFDWVKRARSFEDRRDRMLQMDRCDEDILFDDTLTNYFSSLSSNRNFPAISQCEHLRVNCDQLEPRSHRNYYNRNSKCFENWYSTADVSFVEKCHKYLDIARSYDTEDSLEDHVIENHLNCFKSHLLEANMTVQNIKIAINILEDRIHFANHCHAFHY